MAVLIRDVEAGSVAAKYKIPPGATLLQINGHEINDVLDYRYYLTETLLHVYYRTPDGKFLLRRIRKGEYEDLGLTFDTYLMDQQMHCNNKCIFCFIDQLPPGLRESLYFKDDDSRLSFFYGNYITLTNMRDSDIDRIIEMHISPINISVHTMNPELRVKMMKNPKSGEALKHLYRLAEAEIPLNAQLVLCPGINDGHELLYTLSELGKLQPSVQSIACVPLGVTRYRDGLPELTPYTKETAAETLDLINACGDRFRKELGTRLVFASDEFYLMADRPIPDADFYEGYPQLDNGVGLLRSFMDEAADALADPGYYELRQPDKPYTVSLAVGAASYPTTKALCANIMQQFPNADIRVYEILNDFFGHTVTVSGLITGQDLIAQLKGKELGQKLLLPANMVRTTYPRDHSADDLMLDNTALGDVERELNITVGLYGNNGAEFTQKLLEEELWQNQ